jgi:uncharacterized protein YwgA
VGESMTEILDYGLDSPARALLVLILAIEDRTKQKAMNKLHFHKAIYYFENLRGDKEVSFSNYKYGGVSFELTENMETLEESGLVTRVGTKYTLTPEGERLAKQLTSDYGEHDPDTLRKLEYAKILLNDLTDRELLFFMYMTFPETQVNSIEFENLVKDKSNWTRRLFLRGRINAATGAQWLGMNQRDFLNSLSACDQ